MKTNGVQILRDFVTDEPSTVARLKLAQGCADAVREIREAFGLSEDAAMQCVLGVIQDVKAGPHGSH